MICISIKPAHVNYDLPTHRSPCTTQFLELSEKQDSVLIPTCFEIKSLLFTCTTSIADKTTVPGSSRYYMTGFSFNTLHVHDLRVTEKFQEIIRSWTRKESRTGLIDFSVHIEFKQPASPPDTALSIVETSTAVLQHPYTHCRTDRKLLPTKQCR